MNTLTLPEKNGAKRETKDHRRILGKAGEETAAKILSEAGLVIRERNWRAGRIGELDLIAHEGEKTIIVEVRTRIGQRLGTPLESVDRRKIAKLRRLAGQWSSQNRLRQPICIDVIALGLPPQARERLPHIKEDTDLRTLGAEVTWVRGVA
ncbi:YraN family protein [Schaalia cardiffensis]|nr:YraN family protein [Schaalia cardiffensis]MBJ2328302.1 YraN family protein [Schaalia cardiffensis]